MSAIYSYSAIAESTFKQRFSVGQIPTVAQLKNLQRCCTVLANQRWSLSFSFSKGYDFSSGTVNFFYPIAGSGHQLIYGMWSAATMPTAPAMQHYTMNGSYQFGSVASSTAADTSFTWPTAVSNPSASKLVGSANLTSYVGLSYRDPSQYGCGRITFNGFTGTGPMNFLVMPRPYAGYNQNQFVMLGPTSTATNNTCTPVINDDVALWNINGGWLRACEEMLDVAESMPVWVYNLPWWSGLATGNTAPFTGWNVNAASCPRYSAFRRWVPLVNLSRPRSLWVAVYSTPITSSTADSVTVKVNDFTTTVYAQTYDRCWYKPQYYRLYEVPLPAEAFRCSRDVAGIPMAQVSVSTSVNAMSSAAWIGDRR